MKRQIRILSLPTLCFLLASFRLPGADSVHTVFAHKTVVELGVASWYGDVFHGKPTASGEIYDTTRLTAAHKTLPFGTEIIVENLANGKYVVVRINDRGPFVKDRIIDLSRAAAAKIGMVRAGTAKVRLRLAMGDSSVIDLSDIKTPHYTIQIAAYKDLNLANDKAEDIEGAYVIMTFREVHPSYRVYFGYYSDKQSAIEALSILEKRGLKGIIRQLEND